MGRPWPASASPEAPVGARPPAAEAAPRGSAAVRRHPPERLAAWLVTGPLGHLYATLADIAVLWGAWARTRLARRSPAPRRGGG